MVQSPFSPAMPWVKFLQHLARRAACASPPGGTGRRRSGGPRRRSPHRATRPRWRRRRSPRGMATILSPWLIQTVSSSPTAARPASSGRGLLDGDLGAAELAGVAALDLAAQLFAHGHLAVADAQHRHAQPRTRLAARAGCPLRARWLGTARQDDGRRRHGRQRRLDLVVGMDLAIDAGLAQAPRDQLGHLAAEIDDQDLLVGVGARSWGSVRRASIQARRRRSRRCRRSAASGAGRPAR